MGSSESRFDFFKLAHDHNIGSDGDAAGKLVRPCRYAGEIDNAMSSRKSRSSETTFHQNRNTVTFAVPRSH